MQIVMSHCDDEIIFGWPVLKQAKSILICSSDQNNPMRVWCQNRYRALEEVCNYLGLEVVYLDYNSEFYRLPTRDESLKKMLNDVLSYTQEEIFTHNSWGEYGHLDHILIHNLLKHKHIYYSDIAIENNWMPINKHISGTYIKTVENDLDIYNKCKSIYDKHGCWTWDQAPILKANIYENSNSLQREV